MIARPPLAVFALALFLAASSTSAQTIPAGAATQDSSAAVADTTETTKAEPASDEVPQKDVMDIVARLLNRRVSPQVSGTLPAGFSWTILPTISYNPVYGVAIGAMISGAGHRGLLGTRISQLALAGNYSTEGQLQVQLRGDVFSETENYLLKMDLRYLDTERSTWGLGPINSAQQEYPMEFDLSRAYVSVYRRASGPVYLGLGYHYDQFDKIVDERAANGESTPFTEYSGGAPTKTVASGFSVNILGDTRDNIVNPREGYYLVANFRNYTKDAGSDTNWQEVWMAMRLYPHVPSGSRNVLAFWMYTWFTFGNAPYLNLPANGWDTYGRSARGYLQGRIRGSDLVYFETEYRHSLRRDGLLGGVVFVNATVTTNPASNTFGRADPGGGVGLRIKFNKKTDTNLTIDMGFGRDGQRGLFLGMTEVF